jgi:hypothetical protein
MERKLLPSRFSAVSMELLPTLHEGAAGDPMTAGATRPARLFARTVGPAYSPAYFGGRVYHDFEGMRLANPVMPIEYRHGDGIGYFDRLQVVEGVGLYLDGTLVFDGSANDPARVYVTRKDAGVPYEASITTGAEILVEEVQTGQFAQVNGQTVEGPCAIAREWTLRGVGVCVYGADEQTSAMFSADGGVAVLSLENPDAAVVTPGGDRPGMSTPATAAAAAPVATTPAPAALSPAPAATPAPAPAPVPALAAEPIEEPAPPAIAPPEAGAPTAPVAEQPAAPPADPALDPNRQEAIQQLSQFTATFDPAEGPGAGARYFSAGLTFSAALQRSHAVLTQKNQQLRQQLSGAAAAAAEGGGLGDEATGKFAAAGGVGGATTPRKSFVKIVGA